MTESNLLDLLIGSIIVLVAVIGYWQGIVRSLLYLTGALLGSELALWWSDNVGDRLGDWLPMESDTGRFVSAVLMILVSMLLIGAGLGSSQRFSIRDRRSRAGGVVIGAFWGAITVGFVIRYFFIHLETRATDALSDTRVATFLWDQFDWIIAAAVVTAAAMMIIGWVLGPTEIDQDSLVSPISAYAVAKQSDRRLAPVADIRIDPNGPSEGMPPSYSAPSGSEAKASTRSSDELSPNAAYASSVAPASTTPEFGRAPVMTRVESVHDSEDQGGRSSADGTLSNIDIFAPLKTSVTETVTFATENAADRRASAGMCPNCGMLLRQSDAFCPDCGFPTEV